MNVPSVPGFAIRVARNADCIAGNRGAGHGYGLDRQLPDSWIEAIGSPAGRVGEQGTGNRQPGKPGESKGQAGGFSRSGTQESERPVCPRFSKYTLLAGFHRHPFAGDGRESPLKYTDSFQLPSTSSLGMAGSRRSSTLGRKIQPTLCLLGMAGSRRSSTLTDSPCMQCCRWGWPGVAAQVH